MALSNDRSRRLEFNQRQQRSWSSVATCSSTWHMISRFREGSSHSEASHHWHGAQAACSRPRASQQVHKHTTRLGDVDSWSVAWALKVLLKGLTTQSIYYQVIRRLTRLLDVRIDCRAHKSPSKATMFAENPHPSIVATRHKRATRLTNKLSHTAHGRAAALNLKRSKV